MNATKAVHHLGDAAFYVEGWAVVNSHSPYVIEHGWCEIEGKIIDTSYAPFVTAGVHQLVPPIAYVGGLRYSRTQLGALRSLRRLPLSWSMPGQIDYERAFLRAWGIATAPRQLDVIPAPATMVVNSRNQEFDEFIGRPSRWSNPYRMGPDGDRLQVNAKYREWLIRQPLLLREVQYLRGLRLGCRCAPLPCHGDVIAELANFIEPRPPLPAIESARELSVPVESPV
jgi:hypothetical protein